MYIKVVSFNNAVVIMTSFVIITTMNPTSRTMMAIAMAIAAAKAQMHWHFCLEACSS